jgi:hypothetical protein
MSPQTKRRFAIIIITLFSFIIVTGIGNFRAKQLAVDISGDMVTKAVSNAVTGLDIGKLQAIINSQNKQDPYYLELRKMLAENREAYNLENIYILYKDEKEPRWFYVADAREENDPSHTPLGKTEKRVSAAVEKTIRGKAVQGEYYTTSLGPMVSSYQEIKNEQGKIFAVMGADFKAAEMTDFLYLTRYAQMGVAAAALLLIGLILLLVPIKTAK